MRVAVLTKQVYMSHDVIRDRYGRLYQLPAELARLGHDVLGICLNYRAPAPRVRTRVDGDGRLRWVSFGAGPVFVGGLPSYFLRMVPMVREFKPNLILGCADALHVILAGWLAEKLGVPYWVDLYDNFESFGLSKLPGVTTFYRRALRRSEGVSTVSEPLCEYVQGVVASSLPVETIESTVGTDIFIRREKSKARKELGLPKSAFLVGAAGSLDRSRGIGLLYRAFEILVQELPTLRLVLAGNLGRRERLPVHPGVYYLGRIPHDKMADLYSALDLAVVCMRDTEFGRYAFPQKTYEILSCRTPIVTARLGALERTLKNFPGCLYEPDDLEDLIEKIRQQLRTPCVPDIPIPTWADQGKKLAGLLEDVLAGRTGAHHPD